MNVNGNLGRGLCGLPDGRTLRSDATIGWLTAVGSGVIDLLLEDRRRWNGTSGTSWCSRCLRTYMDAASGSREMSSWSGYFGDAIPA